tara:strand:+ start:1104 stop:1547 length:444 start_codon:yes stop_codon:yes gene_type:complete
MNKYIVALFALSLMPIAAHADEWCDGYETGYKLAKINRTYFNSINCILDKPGGVASLSQDLGFIDGVEAGMLKANNGGVFSYANDLESGNVYVTIQDKNGHTTVFGRNASNGSEWRNEIETSGDQSGTDSSDTDWTYDKSSDRYKQD